MLPMAGKYRLGCVLALLYCWTQVGAAAERWQIVVLPDINYITPIELPALTDLHTTISEGLTIELTNADFDVLNLHYLGLANCIIEDCSGLTDESIRLAASRSGKQANLALLYQLTAFKKRQAATVKWYFSLSGRLLDLHSGIQQDAFAVNNWVNSPSNSCIAACLTMWLNQNLALLAQDLGAVLGEKLDALPRRFHYQLNLNNFDSVELQQIDSHLKRIEGYLADKLLVDSQTEDQPLNFNNTSRTYQYISELTASELRSELEKLGEQYSLPVTFEYDNGQRQFNLVRKPQTDSWGTLSQFISGILRPSSVPATLQTAEDEIDEEKQALREQQMWQQASAINTFYSYQQYLTIWPDGQYIIQAQANIKDIQDDESAWQQTTIENTQQGFQQYLALKPMGKYRQQAKRQISLLREQQIREQKQIENKTLADNYYYRQQNYSEALYYYKQAAELGHASSQYLLGEMYEQAKGTKRNMRQAANWYAQAAKQGHVMAQATLGFMYSKGSGVNQDYSLAVIWYQKAAEQGHVNAQYNLGYLYSLGQSVSKNYQQAAYWYKKSALQGDSDAQNGLGKLYETGLGVEKDLSKAISLYQQSASQGNQIARINLQMLKQ